MAKAIAFPSWLLERFWSQVDQGSGCWLWTGPLFEKGYGRFSVFGGTVRAHCFSYEAERGAVPDGLELDHLCQRKSCVRPSHLEPVTHAENVRRGGALERSAAAQRAKTHCPSGHLYDQANTYRNPTNGSRTCRACRRIGVRKAA